MNKFRSAILSGRGVGNATPLVAEKAPRGSVEAEIKSVNVARQDHRTADHRDGDRHRLANEKAEARYRGKTHSVDLINLSGGGAMIAAAFSPYLWERVDLILGEGAPIEAAVRWVRHDRIGLEFAHETTIDCAPEQRIDLLLTVLERSFPESKTSIELPKPVEPAPAPKKLTATDAARRADIRHPLVWTGRLYHAHDMHEVRLRNIGTNGALIDLAPGLKVGDHPMLDLGNGVELLGTVAWARGEQAGIRFEHPFDLNRLGDVAPKLAGSDYVRPTYLDQRADVSDPWAQGWNRQSVEEMRESLEGFLKR